MSMIFGTIEIPYMPVYVDVPLGTTRYEVQANEGTISEFEVETNKDHHDINDESAFEVLTSVDEVVVVSRANFISRYTYD